MSISLAVWLVIELFMAGCVYLTWRSPRFRWFAAVVGTVVFYLCNAIAIRIIITGHVLNFSNHAWFDALCLMTAPLITYFIVKLSEARASS